MFNRKHKKTRPYVPRKIKTADMVTDEILIKEIAKNPYLGLRIALQGQGIDIPENEDVIAAAKEEVIRNMIRNDSEFRAKIKQNYLSKIKLTRDIGGDLDDTINRYMMEKLRNDPALADKFRRRVREENKKSSIHIPYSYLNDVAKFKKVIDSLHNSTGESLEDMENSYQEDTDNAITESIEENEIEETKDSDIEE